DFKFAENFYRSANNRRFNVAINGTTLLSNFDIVAAAKGALPAIDKTFPTTVTNGQVNIQFTKGTADLPQVNAIEITLPAGIVATPTFSPAPGTYPTAQSVTLSDATPGATIYYTTDGSPATTSSAVYSAPITVSAGTVTINAIAAASGLTTSGMASGTYTISTSAAVPTFSPAPGTYTTAQSVTLSDATPGATIYYTTDGSPATTSSPVYSTPISVSAGTVTINAIAGAPGFTTSSMASGTYTISVGGFIPIRVNAGGPAYSDV